MRYLAIILLPLVGIYFGTANAEIINGSLYGSRRNLDADVVVMEKAKVLVNSIYATGYVYLDNRGTVKVKNIYVPERGFSIWKTVGTSVVILLLVIRIIYTRFCVIQTI